MDNSQVSNVFIWCETSKSKQKTSYLIKICLFWFYKAKILFIFGFLLTCRISTGTQVQLNLNLVFCKPTLPLCNYPSVHKFNVCTSNPPFNLSFKTKTNPTPTSNKTMLYKSAVLSKPSCIRNLLTLIYNKILLYMHT